MMAIFATKPIMRRIRPRMIKGAPDSVSGWAPRDQAILWLLATRQIGFKHSGCHLATPVVRYAVPPVGPRRPQRMQLAYVGRYFSSPTCTSASPGVTRPRPSCTPGCWSAPSACPPRRASARRRGHAPRPVRKRIKIEICLTLHGATVWPGGDAGAGDQLPGRSDQGRAGSHGARGDRHC